MAVEPTAPPADSLPAAVAQRAALLAAARAAQAHLLRLAGGDEFVAQGWPAYNELTAAIRAAEG